MNINFMKEYKKIFYMSLFLFFCSIFFIFGKGLNLGIDFTGGFLIEISKSEENINLDKISEALNEKGIKNFEAHYFGNNREVVVRMGLEDNINYLNFGEEIFNYLKTVDNDIILNRTELVGPKVGSELKTAGIISIVLVFLGILFYISFRFEYIFAIGAIFALVHDLIITFFMLSLFKIEFDLTVLAAVLAILGYSLNDTIVVYDRIRENMLKYNEEYLIKIINISINETFSRTIMTSFTTLLALSSLLFLGGEIMKGFSITLIFGVLIGTYSSIYIAGVSLLYLIKSEKYENKIIKDKYVNKEDGVI